MKLEIYSIKDTVLGELGNPFYLQNENVAKRSFANVINNEQSQIALNYKDMQLYRLGTLDTVTGLIESNVEFIMSGTEAKASK